MLDELLEAAAKRVVVTAEAGELHEYLGCECGPTLRERWALWLVRRSSTPCTTCGRYPCRVRHMEGRL